MGNPNNASGNCLYESIIDNVNSRNCFTEQLNNPPEFYRNVWNTEGEEKIKLTGFYPGALSEEEWREGWRKLIYTNEYDVPYIGNFAIVACAHSLKKDILIFNTPWQTDDANANSPISVVSSTQFDPSNERKTEIPIVLLYDGVHFESSIPVSKEDVQRTIDLVRNYTSGNYIIPESLKNDYKSKESLVNENRQNTQHDKSEKTRNDTNILPSLKLKSANTESKFLPTGFKKNQSVFHQRLEDEKVKYCEGAIKIDGKEGFFY